MYKVLVTGATGYIGSHVVKYLGELGYEVDVLTKNEFMAEDWKRLSHFQDSKRKVKPDVVIHCAWIRDQDLDVTDHLEMAEASCNFFQECANRGIRVINLGSSSEYGMHLEPMNEDISVCTPHTTYGIAKLAVTLFAKKLGFNTLRLFAVYGDGGHSFRDHYKESEKLGDRLDNRTWTPIEMVCKAVERLIHAKHIYGEIINVAEYWCTYINLSESEEDAVKWNKYPQRQYEPYRWEADTTKMKELLNL